MDKKLLEKIGLQYTCPNQFVAKEIRLRDGEDGVLWVHSQSGHGVLDPSFWNPESNYQSDYRAEASANSNGARISPKKHIELYDQLDKLQFRRVSGLLGPGAKVLEIGCSYGGVLKEAVTHGFSDCHAVEPNSEDVGFIKITLPEVSVIEGYFLDIDIPEDNFDVVMSFQVLEHMVSPRLFLEKIFRVLKKGGTTHLEVPNHEAALLRYYKDARHSDFYYHRNHIHYFTLASLMELCQFCGFEGKINSEVMYPFFNHVHWHFNQKPQPSAAVALNTPTPCDALTNIGRLINEFFGDVERQYSQLIQLHGVGDILVYQGRCGR